MLNRADEQNHNNPIYSAGFIAGQKFEREQQAAEQAKKKAGAMSVTVKVTEMDVFKDLAEITVELANHIEENHLSPQSVRLLKKIDTFQETLKQRVEKGKEKRESEGVTVSRI